MTDGNVIAAALQGVHNGVGVFLGENDITVATMARHIDHAVQLAGPEHVPGLVAAVG